MSSEAFFAAVVGAAIALPLGMQVWLFVFSQRGARFRKAVTRWGFLVVTQAVTTAAVAVSIVGLFNKQLFDLKALSPTLVGVIAFIIFLAVGIGLAMALFKVGSHSKAK